MNKKTLIVLVTAAAIAVLSLKGKNLLEERKSQISNASLPQQKEISIRLIKPKQGRLEEKNSYLAHVQSDKSIAVSTKLTGYIEHIAVEESQKIQKGDLLARIDDKELRSAILGLQSTYAQQKSDADLAKQIYHRNIQLYKVGGLAKEQVDISRVAMQNKEAIAVNTQEKIMQLKHQLSYLTIRAPFDGEIETVMQHEGDLATPGKPILSLNNGNKKLVFSYTAEASPIQKGQKVFIGEKETGEIKTIYATAQNGLMRAETANIPTLSVPVDSFLHIEVLKKEASGCLLPNDAILHDKEGSFVMGYAKNAFTPLPVQLIMQEDSDSLVEPCPDIPIAQASEPKLKQLPLYGKVHIAGTIDE